ncbi:zeta toxin family protein [Pseudoflavonifractor capillosus]|uniref:zeta toxin family protein n=1 Tax=Pseudoflavonifractor capillosus TaxID=106588 RepID=UPI00195BD01E|nr:zeta toxin family protein [Pseudoflavonifractor capillosus]MBM6897535.1 zeta toxin family protein [Pseudoflavonifractor capillosus]
MPDYARDLNTDIQAEKFVDRILGITDVGEKRQAINLITQAERNIKDYPLYPTITHQDNRDFQYRDEKAREALRVQIVNELFTSKRIANDDEITLGRGGAMPLSDVKFERTVFYVIGPPAAGKSSIASKIADHCGCYILDSDFTKRKLPEYTNQIGAASLVHEESDFLVFGENGLMDQCLQCGANLVIPKIGHNIASIIKFCTGLKNAGYKVFLVSVDLDRQKATKRAYKRFINTNRYVPLSLIFDGYSNEPTLNYFRLKQQNMTCFDGYCQISTDVPMGQPFKVIESMNIDLLNDIDWG